MNTTASLRVLIVDPSPVILEGLAAIIARQPTLSLVGKTASEEEAVALCRDLRPHLVLMEVRLSDGNGIKATRAICRNCPQTRVVIFAFSDLEEDIFQAFQAGAKAYLLKDTPPDVLLDTLYAVQEGRACVPPEVAERLVERSQASALTGRELQVLRALVAGKSNCEIGQELFIAEGTVKSHMNNILGKLNVQDRTQAVVLALRRGLVRLS